MVVMAFSPLLKRAGYGLTGKEGAILVFGGLRGAVGLVMSLIVEHNEHINSATSQMIAFHTAGIVLLTLLVNGSTVDHLYRWLEIYPINPFRRKYLRKVLAELEESCRSRDIRQLADDWFFRECQFKIILRCVPNFAHIDFDEGGTPFADGIMETKTVLRSLEADANLHKQSFIMDRRMSFENYRIEERFAQRRTDVVEKFQDVLTDKEGIQDRKDVYAGVSSTGDHKLVYHPKDGLRGHYVSVRPLTVVGTEEHEEYFFDVTIVKAENCTVRVGLIAGAEEMPTVDPPAGGQPPILGTSDLVSPSGCLNCKSGEIIYNGLTGTKALPPTEESGFSAYVAHGQQGGARVEVRVGRRAGSEWEVRFQIGWDDNTTTERAVTFGPYAPGELYPMIEFNVQNGGGGAGPTMKRRMSAMLGLNQPGQLGGSCSMDQKSLAALIPTELLKAQGAVVAKRSSETEEAVMCLRIRGSPLPPQRWGILRRTAASAVTIS
jgi:hypothetical protein